ncbi:RagB/SusD family nutrient uptake outer membrane protein [Winogradskyella bathintestinalis]|uniref:RagB/SusD family nutrient uptake outer membrane protein n=1 Tax=Winogradskyella bathintestinalis TaxID=3035208 RepID=A0ABT7ZQ82_9FLAO|nr:RagB/SusD family nutrient uptake outer membrane protein [Winogradskyella bathintestinalis]MDN3491128.1 RagB/SusD family nutrient uptake outer membrane protein [Winogradskyella bathintestinalis]
MKNLKQGTKQLALMLSFCVIVFSCNDKLEENDGQLAAGDVDYTISEDMNLPLIGAYSAVYSRGWEDPILIGVRGDDVNAGGLGDQQPLADTDLFIYDNNYWMYNQIWENFYGDIVRILSARETIQLYQNFATEEEYLDRADQYMAECKVLSGFTHFQMSRLWGDIFIIGSTDIALELENGVKTKAEVMQYISDLMDEAIPFLPNKRPNEREDVLGGVTKYTALAIKAMANLELENYQGVANATGEIIESNKFMLYPEFYELFKKPGELSNESLFELQFSDYNTEDGAANNHLFAPFGPSSWTPAVEGASAGWGFYEPSLKYIKFMIDRGDQTRLVTSVNFTPRGIDELMMDPQYASLPNYISNTTLDGDIFNDYPRAMFGSGKHYLPSNQLTAGRTSYGSSKNLIVIRYAEILLMHAEALTQGASSSAMTADAAVNMVRGRVGMPSLSGVTNDQVMDEKFAELAMEWGIRYFDMIRLNNYDELSYDGRTFTADKELLPYPQAQLDLLPLESDNN